ncbi:F-box protein At3g07870-like [Coffea arabica]|uniref:F-box protein At3g07870-like n=1 Tax=Coffea arabica TaxID=13443 RepID=A0A6P6XHX4_COFAR|nr:F-box protein At3g07870-like [Coffea arabica]
MENIPQEILIEILIRLPVKSLIRFILVSKTWQCLITSPNFIFTHLKKIQNQPNKKHSLLLCRHYSRNDQTEHYSLHPDNDDFVHKSSKIRFPLKSKVGCYRIVGCCNGLVCLCDDMFGTFRLKPIILWNPSVQKSIELPLPSIQPYWDRSRIFLLGFGCDFQGFDYKVVRIVYDRLYGLSVGVEVYSLSTKSWKVLAHGPQTCPRYYITGFCLSQVFVNGVMHWLAHRRKGSFGNSIMGFDMKDEIFIEIFLPEALVDERAANLFLMKHGGCLAVMKYNGYENIYSLWVMKEYRNVESWKRLYNIGLVEGMENVIGFSNNGHLFVTMFVDEMFVSDPASGVLVSFDLESRKIKDLEIFGKLGSIYVENFVESLVLLEG